jgi:hypothetical protein
MMQTYLKHNILLWRKSLKNNASSEVFKSTADVPWDPGDFLSPAGDGDFPRADGDLPRAVEG